MNLTRKFQQSDGEILIGLNIREKKKREIIDWTILEDFGHNREERNRIVVGSGSEGSRKKFFELGDLAGYLFAGRSDSLASKKSLYSI